MSWDHLRDKEVDMPECTHDVTVLLQSQGWFYCHDCGKQLGESLDQHRRKSTIEKQG